MALTVQPSTVSYNAPSQIFGRVLGTRLFLPYRRLACFKLLVRKGLMKHLKVLIGFPCPHVSASVNLFYKFKPFWTRTQNHIVLKRTLNHLAKLDFTNRISISTHLHLYPGRLEFIHFIFFHYFKSIITKFQWTLECWTKPKFETYRHSKLGQQMKTGN